MRLSQLFTLLVLALFPCAAAATITIATAPIDNPGNLADTRYPNTDHPNGVGAVPYSFLMGKTEVTNTQYVAFLTAVAATDPFGLYDTNMGTTSYGGIVRNGTSGHYTYSVKAAALSGAYTYGDKPVGFVDCGDTMRFANWLHNGQPTGTQNAATTEDGAYTLNGAVTRSALTTVVRNPGARWWLPNEDEWHKAAYHKNDGATGNYWDYPTRSDIEPNNNLPSSDTGNSANLYNNVSSTTGNPSYPATDAGGYTLSASAYGTFDQAGNAEEWVETLFRDTYRELFGGSWDTNAQAMRASYMYDAVFPDFESRNIGFRVASAAVPEPSAMLLAGSAITLLASHRRRRGLFFESALPLC